ncbi:interferon gamma related [Clinocottus analis]|uniref:interferon gamma related n=1 Tax=Clinocottus analis TaxID=304258 RepID=UPI0035BFBA58
MVSLVLCVTLWLSVWHVQAAFNTADINSTIKNLLQHYKIPEARARFDRKPVFSRDPLAGNMEATSVFMSGVLEKYEELIGRMLEQLPTPTPHTAASDQLPASAAAAGGGEVATQLRYILKKVQLLKKHRYHEQEKFLRELRALKDIQMDNPVVQSKALGEFPLLYEKASSINVTMTSRRRRQARRNKTRPRA